jgi:hypothetical protein
MHMPTTSAWLPTHPAVLRPPEHASKREREEELLSHTNGSVGSDPVPVGQDIYRARRKQRTRDSPLHA